MCRYLQQLEPQKKFEDKGIKKEQTLTKSNQHCKLLVY
jgi:hypothetical protein